jgi:LacI family transcriptional regulator
VEGYDFGIMSIQRIADLAGVPYSTTWRAINRRSGVSLQAAEAVRKAMEQMGYNQSAERRRKPKGASTTGRKLSVAMLYLRQNTPLSMAILRAVQRILIDQRINLVFGHVASPEDLPPAVLSGEIDGILGYGEFPDAAVTPQVMQIPAVWMMSRTEGGADAWGDRIMADHRAIGELATRYLIDKGHRHLAFLNPAPGHPFIGERGQGFESAAEAKGHSYNLVSSDLALRANGPEAVEQVVARWAGLNPRPTGLFVPTDLATLAVYLEMSRRGIRPGRDVEIVSCDQRKDQLSQLNPEPVSIDLNREVIARLAVERLLWRMRERSTAPAVRIVVSPTLSGYAV